jgi:hypothetical protein
LGFSEGCLAIRPIAWPGRQRFNGGMSDPMPGNDPNAAYDVVPSERWPKDWWTVKCNGIPMWHAPDRRTADRYATDPEHRARLITKKLWEKNAGR